MTAPTEVKVPDIGGFNDVPVIEVHVNPATRSTPRIRWSRWSRTRPRWTCPRPQPGSVAEVLVKVGDTVSEGTPILLLQPG